MPDLIGILHQIRGPGAGARVKAVVSHAGDENRKFDAPLGHVYADFPEFFLQNRQKLPCKCAARRAEHFKSKWNTILVANTVLVMIDPSRFIQQFRSAFRIIR